MYLTNTPEKIKPGSRTYLGFDGHHIFCSQLGGRHATPLDTELHDVPRHQIEG